MKYTKKVFAIGAAMVLAGVGLSAHATQTNTTPAPKEMVIETLTKYHCPSFAFSHNFADCPQIQSQWLLLSSLLGQVAVRLREQTPDAMEGQVARQVIDMIQERRDEQDPQERLLYNLILIDFISRFPDAGVNTVYHMQNNDLTFEGSGKVKYVIRKEFTSPKGVTFITRRDVNYIQGNPLMMGGGLPSFTLPEDMQTNNTSSNVETNPDTIEDTREFALNQTNNRYYGTTKVTGYAVLDNLDEWCQERYGSKCSDDRTSMFFQVLETENDDFDDYFLKGYNNNPLVQDQRLNLGCVEDNMLWRLNSSDAKGMQRYYNTTEELEILTNSNSDSLVTLQITHPLLTNGGEAPGCYSHFGEVVIIDYDEQVDSQNNSIEQTDTTTTSQTQANSTTTVINQDNNQTQIIEDRQAYMLERYYVNIKDDYPEASMYAFNDCSMRGKDFSNNQRHGSVQGNMICTPGLVGNAMRVEGTMSDIVRSEIPMEHIQEGQDFSIAFALKKDNNTKMSILHDRNTCKGVNMRDVRIGSDRVLAELYGESSYGYTPSSTTRATVANPQERNHYVIQRNNNAWEVYINGALSSSSYISDDLDITMNELMISNNPCEGLDGTTAFRGTLDELYVFPRALNTMEVYDIYTGL